MLGHMKIYLILTALTTLVYVGFRIYNFVAYDEYPEIERALIFAGVFALSPTIHYFLSLRIKYLSFRFSTI